MNVQQMIMQAQKMQREMQKAQEELAKKEFKISKNGIVDITIMGDKKIVSINISDTALDIDDKEFLELAIKDAINEAIAQIDDANEAIQARIANKIPGF